MPLFRTRLFELCPNNSPKPPYRSRGWSATLRDLSVVESDISAAGQAAKKRLFFGSIIGAKKLSRGKLRVTFAPEVIVKAKSKEDAQMAANIITATKCLFDGDYTSGEMFEVIPDDPDFEFDPMEHGPALGIITTGHARAAAVAAKIAKSDRLTYALTKYWLSLRTCSVPSIEHHPRYGTKFTVARDPFNHAIMAQAIVAAYSAIEELGVAIKASEKRPSKLPDGTWNPLVLNDLRQSLAELGIETGDEFYWLIRSSPTRIEKKYPVPAGQKANWAIESVRDRKIAVIDAIHYCGLLRSRVSAHRTGRLTKSLTMYHVINAQHLARQMLLQTLGEWRRDW